LCTPRRLQSSPIARLAARSNLRTRHPQARAFDADRGCACPLGWGSLPEIDLDLLCGVPQDAVHRSAVGVEAHVRDLDANASHSERLACARGIESCLQVAVVLDQREAGLLIKLAVEGRVQLVALAVLVGRRRGSAEGRGAGQVVRVREDVDKGRRRIKTASRRRGSTRPIVTSGYLACSPVSGRKPIRS
jgi:hypothetical protein